MHRYRLDLEIVHLRKLSVNPSGTHFLPPIWLCKEEEESVEGGSEGGNVGGNCLGEAFERGILCSLGRRTTPAF